MVRSSSVTLPELNGAGTEWYRSRDLGSPRGANLARERVTMREFREVGASWHPLYRSMRQNSVREAMHRAQEIGGLPAMQQAVRMAKAHVGDKDPAVQHSSKVLKKAEQAVRACRDSLVVGELRALPQAMNRIAFALGTLERLGKDMGPAIWEDRNVVLAREKVVAWMAHKPTLTAFIEKINQSPRAYCLAWARLAAGDDAEFKAHFGDIITRELTTVPNVCVELVNALSEIMASDVVDFSKEYKVTLARILRCSLMLGQLDSQPLDKLVAGEERGCKSSLRIAAERGDILVFAALQLPLRAELLMLPPGLQEQLENVRSRPLSPLHQLAIEEHEQETAPPRIRWAATELGKILRVPDSSQLYLRRRTGGSAGLVVRLHTEAGQPAASEAQALLGNGAMVESRRHAHLHAGELATLDPALACGSEFFRQLQARDFQDSREEAAKERAADHLKVHGELTKDEQQVQAVADEATAKSAEADARVEQLGSAIPEAWKAHRAAYKLCQDLMMDEEEGFEERNDKAQEEHRKTAALYDSLKAEEQVAKEEAVAARETLSHAMAELHEVQSAMAEVWAEHEAALQEAAEAAEASAKAADRCQILQHQEFPNIMHEF